MKRIETMVKQEKELALLRNRRDVNQHRFNVAIAWVLIADFWWITAALTDHTGMRIAGIIVSWSAIGFETFYLIRTIRMYYEFRKLLKRIASNDNE